MILQGTERDPLSMIFSLIFYAFFFLSIFYGTKIQAYRSLKTLQGSLDKFKKWNQETKELTILKFKKFCDPNVNVKDIESRIEDFMNFVMIYPTTLDPAGIIPKLDHLLDVRENKYLDEVRRVAVNADEVQLHNLENLLEAAMAVNEIYRVLLHYTLLGKKSKSYIILMQVEMQLSLLESLAKSYVSASKAFAEGSPIGDSLGPMVAAAFVREVTKSDAIPYDEITYQTIKQEIMFENRKIYVIRAKGPGGTVGKPGDAIEQLIEQHKEKIKLVIMIDAGLKMEGDKTGSIVTGIGAAIGGVGNEKFKIETSITKDKIPIDAIICRESLEDAICTMKKSIAGAVPQIIQKIKASIRLQTKENDEIIVAGIGNTIGVGI